MRSCPWCGWDLGPALDTEAMKQYPDDLVFGVCPACGGLSVIAEGGRSNRAPTDEELAALGENEYAVDAIRRVQWPHSEQARN